MTVQAWPKRRSKPVCATGTRAVSRAEHQRSHGRHRGPLQRPVGACVAIQTTVPVLLDRINSVSLAFAPEDSQNPIADWGGESTRWQRIIGSTQGARAGAEPRDAPAHAAQPASAGASPRAPALAVSAGKEIWVRRSHRNAVPCCSSSPCLLACSRPAQRLINRSDKARRRRPAALAPMASLNTSRATRSPPCCMSADISRQRRGRFATVCWPHKPPAIRANV